jgi:hypothetical protein
MHLVACVDPRTCEHTMQEYARHAAFLKRFRSSARGFAQMKSCVNGSRIHRSEQESNALTAERSAVWVWASRGCSSPLETALSIASWTSATATWSTDRCGPFCQNRFCMQKRGKKCDSSCTLFFLDTHPLSSRRQPTRIMWALAVATLALSAAAPFGQYPVCCPVFRLRLSLRRESGEHVRSCLRARARMVGFQLGALFSWPCAVCAACPYSGHLRGGSGTVKGMSVAQSDARSEASVVDSCITSDFGAHRLLERRFAWTPLHEFLHDDMCCQ